MTQKLFFLRVWVLSLMLLTLSSTCYSMTDEEDNISLNVVWIVPDKGRSFFFPFTATHDASTVTIYNDKPVCDLIIAIIDQETGAEVYSQEVSAENSGYVVIPVSDLGDGSYCLTISNPEAGYVYGYFNL